MARAARDEAKKFRENLILAVVSNADLFEKNRKEFERFPNFLIENNNPFPILVREVAIAF